MDEKSKTEPNASERRFENAVEKSERRFENTVDNTVKTTRLVSYSSLVVAVVAILIAGISLFRTPTPTTSVTSSILTTALATTTPPINHTVKAYNITSPLITPQTSLSDAPVITQQQPFGSRLTDINAPFNATELAIINNAPDSYFEEAGEMLLNHTLNTVNVQPANITELFIVNGKPSMIYLGAISCIFCGENKWAMALALGRFGHFNYLFKGYSAIQDGDVPTLYWSPAHYNSTAGFASLGDFYNSSYINFLSIEYDSQIRSGFSLPQSPLSYFLQQAQNQGNLAYTDAMKFIIGINTFAGTPYTIWGRYIMGGADAVAFTNGSVTLMNMTHAQVLMQLSNPKNQFSLTQYAGADVYIAMMCSGINNTAPVCSLPAITGIEQVAKLH